MDQTSDRTAPADVAGAEALEPAFDAPSCDEQPQAAAAAPSGAVAPGAWSLRNLLGVAGAAVGGAAIVLTMLVPRSGMRAVTDAPAAAAHPILPAASAPAVPGPAAVAVRVGWRPADDWVGRRRRSVAFELTAARPVRIWMRQVTPVLVVRCLGGSLDAFVVTESPITIEAGRSDHTVRLAFDGTERVEHWADSAEHDGLFAPDGGAFLARLSHARTLTVGFTPHNAPATEAAFDVSGAADLVTPLKKHCR